MDLSLRPDQVAVFERARALARERFAARAATYDREGRFPWENYQDLHAEGLLALTVPAAYGGLEADPLLYAEVEREFGRACGSTALTFNMHCTVIGFLARLATAEQQGRYFGEVVEHGRFFSTIGSELGASFRRVFVVETASRPVAGGYLINGDKHFCSLVGASSYYFVWTKLEGSRRLRDGLQPIIVPAGTSGVRILPVWDTMAMRATSSDSLEFRDVFAPAENAIGEPGALIRLGLTDGFVLGYAATYLGVAEAALDFIVDYARGKVFKPDTVPISHYPNVQHQIAEMVVAVEAARMLVKRAAWARRDSPDPDERATTLQQAKYLAGETALKVPDMALKIAGGSGIMRTLPLERFIRDARPGVVMPPSSERCLETIGRVTLGLDATPIKLD